MIAIAVFIALIKYNFSIGFFVIAAKANRALSQIEEEEKKVSDRLDQDERDMWRE